MISQGGLSFHTVRGRLDPGDHRLCPGRSCSYIDVFRFENETLASPGVVEQRWLYSAPIFYKEPAASGMDLAS